MAVLETQVVVYELENMQKLRVIQTPSNAAVRQHCHEISVTGCLDDIPRGFVPCQSQNGHLTWCCLPQQKLGAYGSLTL